MIDAKVRVQFDVEKLKQKVQQGNFRSLGHAGGYLAKVAKHSIRRRKKPSAPGQPPHTRTGHLRRVIRYAVEGQSVVIGAVSEFAQTIWDLHEYGGRRRKRLRELRTRRFAVGQSVPIRTSGTGKVTWIRASSQAQADRGAEVLDQANEQRMRESQLERRYPPRPFMRPALDKSKDRLPSHWAASVN